MTDRVARPTAVAVVVAVLLAGVVGGVGIGVDEVAGADSAAPAGSLGSIAGTQVDPDDVSLRIELRPDGTAAWTVEYRVRLDDDNTTRAFESLRDDIAANDTRYASEFRGRMVATADAAENATGRSMVIRNVSVTATRQELPQEYGVLTYTFEWTNFAAVGEGSITAGDALAGFFLDAETSLQFSWPAGYGVEAARPDPDDLRTESRIAVWNGPVDFGSNEPTLAVTDRAAGATATTTGGGGAGAGGGGQGGDSDGDAGNGLPTGAIVAAVVAAVVAAGLVYRWRDDDPVAGAGPTAGSGGTPAADAADAAGPAPGGDAGGAATVAGSGGAGATASDDAADAEAAAGGDADDEPPWEDELLSNQERVLALVEHEGGRMKQQEVAGTLEWTDAKTSQVVRTMREEGDLDAFRLGRENVLVLPGEEFGPSDEDV
jgi:hypothetical protein